MPVRFDRADQVCAAFRAKGSKSVAGFICSESAGGTEKLRDDATNQMQLQKVPFLWVGCVCAQMLKVG